MIVESLILHHRALLFLLNGIWFNPSSCSYTSSARKSSNSCNANGSSLRLSRFLIGGLLHLSAIDIGIGVLMSRADLWNGIHMAGTGVSGVLIAACLTHVSLRSPSLQVLLDEHGNELQRTNMERGVQLCDFLGPSIIVWI